MNVQEVAASNKQTERFDYATKVIKELFGGYGNVEYQFISILETTLIGGLKKERLVAAKELTRLAELYKTNELYIAEKDFENVSGTFEEIVSLSGYTSIEEYIELADQAIEDMYNKEVIHYSKTIDDANDLLPLSKTNVESATNDLEFRVNAEHELNITDCMYATTTTNLENIYGENILKIDTQKYDVVYHLGDTLESFASDCRYSQKPFKKGEFDVFASKFIPQKEMLITKGADAFCFYKAGFGYSVVEVLLKQK